MERRLHQKYPLTMKIEIRQKNSCVRSRLLFGSFYLQKVAKLYLTRTEVSRVCKRKLVRSPEDAN
jgi:hypothetical protein